MTEGGVGDRAGRLNFDCLVCRRTGELPKGCCSAFRSTMKNIPGDSPLKTLHEDVGGSGGLPGLWKNRAAALVFNCLTTLW